MLKALWNGASGLNAQAKKLENISNNIANVDTNGFKKSKSSFQDLIYQAINQIGNPTKDLTSGGNLMQTGVGVMLSTNARDFTQGSLVETNRSLDLAIEGEGLFGIELENGEMMYTRDGNFYLDDSKEGYLINSAGRVKLDQEMKIPGDYKELQINQQGEIMAVTKDEIVYLGRIKLYKFTNQAGLQAEGNNMYKVTAEAGQITEGNPGLIGFGSVSQGFVETSNVELVEEMTQMIQTQRAYETNSHSIKTAEEIWTMANNLRR